MLWGLRPRSPGHDFNTRKYSVYLYREMCRLQGYSSFLFSLTLILWTFIVELIYKLWILVQLGARKQLELYFELLRKNILKSPYSVCTTLIYKINVLQPTFSFSMKFCNRCCCSSWYLKKYAWYKIETLNLVYQEPPLRQQVHAVSIPLKPHMNTKWGLHGYTFIEVVLTNTVPVCSKVKENITDYQL